MNKTAQKSLLAVALASLSSVSLSHGYISESANGIAASRAALCKFTIRATGEKNTGCGGIQYEPQSVEGPDGWPTGGPRDGDIASGATILASALDEQTADRWVKTPIQSGMQKLEWTFTANHVTKDFKYYITKPGWNPNAPLTRASFDLTPFCYYDGGMRQPPTTLVHECNIPQREGYHIILAAWDVGDTAATFYNVIDVKFEGDNTTPPPQWTQGGQIIPTMDLSPGDQVFTRVFDGNGENDNYRTVLTINTTNQGMAANWSQALASKINQEQSALQAGELGADGSFTPAFGNNLIYLLEGSGLQRVEIGYEIATTPDPDPQPQPDPDPQPQPDPDPQPQPDPDPQPEPDPQPQLPVPGSINWLIMLVLGAAAYRKMK